MHATREPHYEFLDPEKLRLFKDGSGRVRLTVEGDRSYLDVKVVRAFPLSHPDRYIGLLDGKDKVIGLVVELRHLDNESRRLALRALERHYFTPTIRRIHRLTEEFGAVYFEVDTDRGGREFVVKGIRDTMEELGDGQFLITDVYGNRYRISDWRRLDVRSRRLLERVL